MADVVNVGITDNDGNGDTLRAAFSQINTRFNELLGTIDGGDAWAPTTAYTATPVRQWVINAGQAYVAAENHTSGATFAADLAAGKWYAVDSAQLRADLLASSGSSIVGYLPAGTGAVATTEQSKLRESVSVQDFGAVGDGVTDDTSAINLANTYCTTNQITLLFPRSTSFYRITANVTLTCDVSAGWYQIFDSGSAYVVAGLREIRFEWWGAKGDAVNPNVAPASFNPATHVPTGNNDTVAIKKAIACATATSMGWSGTFMGGNSPGVFVAQAYVGKQQWYYPCIVKGRPGSSYLVSGTNVFGPQSQVFGASSRFFFDGQGCNFAWLPTLSTDAFIDYLDIWAQPVFQNFSLHTWGFTGNRGTFVRCGDTLVYQNLLDGPRFENVMVDRGGYYYSTTASDKWATGNNALSKIFDINGTNYNADWEISHCLFAGFAKIINCTNPNAVGISIRNTQLFSGYDGITFFEFIGNYGGGFWMKDCIVEMLGNNTTFIKTSGATGSSIPEFHVSDTRMETRGSTFTVIDSEFGQFYIDGLNPNYGNSAATTQTSCYVKKYTKAVVFTNCWCPQNCYITTHTAAEFTTYGGNFDVVKFDGCTFPSGYPIFNWVRETALTAISIPDIFNEFRVMRKVQAINGANHLPVNYGSGSAQPWTADASHTVRLARYDTTNGKSYLNTALPLPVGILITSIQVVADPATLATTDRVYASFSGPAGTTTMLSATLTVKNECITSSQKGISVISTASANNVITGVYVLGVTQGTTPFPAQVFITYRQIMSASEMSAGQLSGATTQAAIV